MKTCACGCDRAVAGASQWAIGHNPNSHSTTAPLERFWPKVRIVEGHPLWTAKRTWNGYGLFYLDGRMVYAHRFAYETFVGCIPHDKELDHVCRRRACVGILPGGIVLDPPHLEVVTHQENCRRGETWEAGAQHQRAKTHCTRGHPYDAANTCISGGKRHCRACQRIRDRQRRRRALGAGTP